MAGNSIKIAVLSGKGGTGKTFVSVNLAAAAGRAVYIDCDVEEPNGHLFFKPINPVLEEVSVMVPQVREELCKGCRKCVDFCKFNALAFIREKPLLFKDICHFCGGCILLCPEQALSEGERTIGRIQEGISEKVKVITGILNTGEASGVPIIQKMVKKVSDISGLKIFDCPPGSACVVMESIKEADYCILVAEPTLFGTHNLQMVYELVKLFGKNYGVVLNKCMEGENPSEEFCIQNKLDIIERIPFSLELGTLNAKAQIAVRESRFYRDLFQGILRKACRGGVV